MVAQSLPVVDCAICMAATDQAEAGVCRHCRERLPQLGGCGMAIIVAAALIVGDENGLAWQHMQECAKCREALETVAEAVSVAHQEADLSEVYTDLDARRDNERRRSEHVDDCYASMDEWAAAEVAA